MSGRTGALSRRRWGSPRARVRSSPTTARSPPDRSRSICAGYPGCPPSSQPRRCPSSTSSGAPGRPPRSRCPQVSGCLAARPSTRCSWSASQSAPGCGWRRLRSRPAPPRCWFRRPPIPWWSSSASRASDHGNSLASCNLRHLLEYVNSMRRLIALAVVVGALVACASASAAQTQVVTDCNTHGKLTRHYSVPQLRNALATLPADVKEYTDCYDVIQRALLLQVGGSSHGGGSDRKGGSSPGGGSGGSFLPT